MSEQRHYAESPVGPQWATPPEIWQPIADTLGGFDLDPASGCEPEPIADERFTVADDGLAQPWFGDVWVNPPYGREFNREWGEKVVAEAQRDAVDTITALVPAATGTHWWHDTYAQGDVFCFLRGRVTFVDSDGQPTDNNASFGSVLVGFGVLPYDYRQALDGMGVLLT